MGEILGSVNGQHYIGTYAIGWPDLFIFHLNSLLLLGFVDHDRDGSTNTGRREWTSKHQNTAWSISGVDSKRFQYNARQTQGCYKTIGRSVVSFAFIDLSVAMIKIIKYSELPRSVALDIVKSQIVKPLE